MTFISIHTPREGSDPRLHLIHPFLAGISIHTPREGSDAVTGKCSHALFISIHTPREGSDKPPAHAKVAYADFNPHSPRGERPGCKGVSFDKKKFQSTLPARGATCLSHH